MSAGPSSRMEILLVEDNMEDANVAIQALRGKVPCRLTLVCDGAEALRFLRREGEFSRVPQPDLILLDMLLPKMAGHELLAEIRADDCLQHIPVVVLTASLVHRALLQREELHVDAFMTKPVELLKFVEVVKSLHRAMLTEFVLSIA